jgi:hypothetical protein
VGGNRPPRGARAAQLIVAALLAAVIGGACNGDDTEPSDVVGSADALVAVVAWQADEQEPVLDDDGAELLPVIFVVPDSGATIDIGVQADVAAATVDWATVRFADDVADAFDPGLEGEPVRDDGVALLIGPMPEPAPSIKLDLVRYSAVDDGESLRLEIESTASSTDTDNATPSASVTSVTQP